MGMGQMLAASSNEPRLRVLLCRPPVECSHDQSILQEVNSVATGNVLQGDITAALMKLTLCSQTTFILLTYSQVH